MSNNATCTYGPITKIEDVDLLSYIDVSGLGDFTMIPFKKRFFWVRESEAEVWVLRNGQRLVKVSGTFADTGTYLKCVESTIDVARQYCETNKVTKDSEIQVVVTLNISDFPAVLDLSPDGREMMQVFHKQIAYNALVEGATRSNYRIARQEGGMEGYAAWVNARKGDNHEEIHEAYESIPWLARANVLKNSDIWDSRIYLDNDAIVMERIEEMRNAVPNEFSTIRGWYTDYEAVLAEKRRQHL